MHTAIQTTAINAGELLSAPAQAFYHSEGGSFLHFSQTGKKNRGQAAKFLSAVAS
ncbi:hypothetical protein [Kamptonema formosum]|uniref:hypothetical protein n=1 Tax=Kamptonema formosum TaxID=331992 RepID=UPI00034574F2|nr:hypothetical protein [Oscillatoria sp. PCC 10802]